MNQIKNTFVIILLQGKAAIFTLNKNKWMNEPINSEEWQIIQNSSTDIKLLVRSLNERINSQDKLHNTSIYILSDREQISCIPSLTNELINYNCDDFQLLQFSTVYQKANVISFCELKSINDEWLCNTLLPTLAIYLNYADDTLDQERIIADQDHQTYIVKLETEKTQLKAQLVELKTAVQALSLPKVEQLLIYMPLFYKNVWSEIKPEDFALLTGNVFDIPAIPSPYREPDVSTQLTLKKRFNKMPSTEKNKIVTFCQQLQHKLTIRPEFTELLEAE